MRVGIDLYELELVGFLTGKRIELLDGFDLIAEQRHAPGTILIVGGKDLDDIAAHPKRPAIEVAGAAFVLQRHQVGDQLPLIDALSLSKRERHRRVGLDRTDTVDARDRRNDDHVVALEQGAGRAVPHAVDLLVDRGFLLDIRIGPGDIGFGLVVVVIADEILDRVIREEALELAIKLSGQRLVGSKHQRRSLGLFDHLRHGESLPGAGHPKQHLRAVLALHPLDQIRDCLRLVSFWRELGSDHEMLPALGFFRARRAVRRPGPLGEFRAAFAQEALQGLNGRGGSGYTSETREAAVRRRIRGRDFVPFETQGLRQLGIDAQRLCRLCAVAGLRRFVEPPPSGLARPVRCREVSASVE